MDFLISAVVVVLTVIIFFLLDRKNRTRADQRKPNRHPASAPAPKRHVPDRPTPAGQRFEAQNARNVSPPTVLRGKAYVVDGDTIRIQKTQIRLFGVDAPEMNHPFGNKAKWAMVNLCKGQIVTAEVTAMDDHGRTVAKCTLNDGRDLSAELVKQGLALDWPKFSGGIYQEHETPDARKRLWLADARQKGRMHVWETYDAREKAKSQR